MSRVNKKTKICYVLPVYDSRTDTHFGYIYDLLVRAGERMDIYVVIERARDGVASIPNAKGVYVQRFRFFPLRVIENFFILFAARVRGYSSFYVHYSYVSAFNAGLVTRFFSGTSYYWNCGMPWLFGEDGSLKTVLDMVHVLVTGTPRMADVYASVYNIPRKKIKILPNWISVAEFAVSFSEEEKNTLRKKLAIPFGEKIVLFVHRLSERKGTKLLPQIISSLAQRNAITVIVGDGPDRETLESSLVELDVAQSVRMVGGVPHGELPLYYAIADLFVMPSLEEGFPHVLLEAMAYGVPFVATDVGGVLDIVPPPFRQYVVSPDNPGDFIVKAGNLLSRTPEEHIEIQHLFRGWVRQYDISLVVHKFEELFHS
ncbi:MAG: glycosyltransferase family 4 protein [bacterium]|nr:glycosyltransferase family 4 protein [bacterium]